MAYAATKGAIANFTAGLVQLLGKQGIRVNSVAPGPIWTPLIPATMPDEAVENFGSSYSMGRPGQPVEAANIAIALQPYLVRHVWPGNVRELENVIERAMLSAGELLHEHGVDEQYLVRVLPELCEGPPLSPARKTPPRETHLNMVGKAAQLRHIQETLESCQGNLDEAARRLGISRTTLWRRLRAAR